MTHSAYSPFHLLLLAGLVACGGLAGCEAEEADDPAPAIDATTWVPDGEPEPEPEPEPESPPDMAPEPEADLGTGCRTDDDCDGPRQCIDGVCIACFGDADCVDGYICDTGECVEGCRDDSTCPAETHCAEGACVEGCLTADHCAGDDICAEGACVDCVAIDPCSAPLPAGCPEPPGDCGCPDDAACGAGEICEDAACIAGCRDDAACGPGHICEGIACVDGCRDDAGCADAICDDGMCVSHGIGCRGDEDCGAGDRCETDRCVPAGEECAPDRLEPNDALDGFTPLMIGQHYDRIGICPGDRDLFGALIPADNILRVRLGFDDPAPILTLRLLDEAGAQVAEGQVGNASIGLEHAVAADGVYLIEVMGSGDDIRSPYVLDATLEAIQMCVDTPVYPDGDGDGFGIDRGAEQRCLEPGDLTPGFARATGDCRPTDPWAHPESTEICGDFVDDDCDGEDVACPESQPAVQVPAWACQGPAPANVYGWARFASGEGYFVDGGCFVFFEGMPGEFYVKRHLDRANAAAGCNQLNGCTCPSLNGWPSYDRRMYAFTLAGDDPDACDPIGIVDHGGEQQAVSNHCRKYLYQLHFYDIPYSLVAVGLEEFERRVTLFPTVEVACAADLPHRNLPYQSLLTAPIERNPAYAPLR